MKKRDGDRKSGKRSRHRPAGKQAPCTPEEIGSLAARLPDASVREASALMKVITDGFYAETLEITGNAAAMKSIAEYKTGGTQFYSLDENRD